MRTTICITLAIAAVSAPSTTAFVSMPGPRLAILPSTNGLSYNEFMSGSQLHMSLKPPEEEQKAPAMKEDLDSTIKQQVDTFDPFHFEQGNSDLSVTPSVQQQLDKEQDEKNGEIGIWAARALLLVVAILWGTNFASVKYLEKLCFHPPCNHPPSEAALARFGVAGLVGLPLLLNQRKDVILAGMECGLLISFGYITQAMALETIGAGKCAFICSLTVVVVPLLSALFYGKPIKPINVASAAVALTGVGILEGLVDFNALLGIKPALADTTTALLSDAASPSSSMVTASTAAAESTGWLANAATQLGVSKGDLLALGQPFGFGFSFMRIEHYVEKYKDVENRILTISAAQCVVVGLISLVWVLKDFGGTLPNFDYMMEPHRLAAIGWTGIMTTVVAIYLEGVALQTASATEAALTFASEPVWASLFGAWLLHEKLGTNAYIGGAVILTACIMGALADLPGAEKVHEFEDEPPE